jgi:hypothetical protein
MYGKPCLDERGEARCGLVVVGGRGFEDLLERGGIRGPPRDAGCGLSSFRGRFSGACEGSVRGRRLRAADGAVAEPGSWHGCWCVCCRVRVCRCVRAFASGALETLG